MAERWPTDYRTTLVVAVAVAVALGWAEARMHAVAAQEVELKVEPVKKDVAALQSRDRLVQQKLDALCRATAASCPLGVE
jgi:hypothetical protein